MSRLKETKRLLQWALYTCWKKERKPAIFIVSLVRQKPLWRRKCWALLTEHSGKVSGFSKHLRRRASYLSPAVTFRERGSKAAGFCLDSIAVVTRRKFGANHLKAVSAVTESLRKQEANHVHSSGKNQAAVLTSVCQPARGEEQLQCRGSHFVTAIQTPTPGQTFLSWGRAAPTKTHLTTSTRKRESP